MLFELFGDRSFIETLIRFPVCSAAQPDEILTNFAETWKTRKDDVEYKRAQELSTPNPVTHSRAAQPALHETLDTAEAEANMDYSSTSAPGEGARW